MKTYIEIKDFKCIDKIIPTYKNINTGEIISEKKFDRYFEYFEQYGKYLGRYNSEVGIFNDDLICVVLDSEYGRNNK